MFSTHIFPQLAFRLNERDAEMCGVHGNSAYVNEPLMRCHLAQNRQKKYVLEAEK